MRDTNVKQVSELYLYAGRIDAFTDNASRAAGLIASATEHDRCEAKGLLDRIESAVDERRRDVQYAEEALRDYRSRRDEDNYSTAVERRLENAVIEAQACYERACKLFEEAKDICQKVMSELSYIQTSAYGAAGRIASAGDTASGVVRKGAEIIENEYKTLQV